MYETARLEIERKDAQIRRMRAELLKLREAAEDRRLRKEHSNAHGPGRR